jgi:hypothetical protein
MSELSQKLAGQASTLEQIAKKVSSPQISEQIVRLRDMANQVGRAWCGSWIGYQSRVYYENLVPPPPGAHFSSE